MFSFNWECKVGQFIYKKQESDLEGHSPEEI